MRKKVGIIKRVSCLGLVFLLSINSNASIVSDNDGSAFITKAEFDALKSSFQAQIDTYNASIDSKIDGAIASYLSGIRLSKIEILTPPIKAYMNNFWGGIPNLNSSQINNNFTKHLEADYTKFCTWIMAADGATERFSQYPIDDTTTIDNANPYTQNSDTMFRWHGGEGQARFTSNDWPALWSSTTDQTKITNMSYGDHLTITDTTFARKSYASAQTNLIVMPVQTDVYQVGEMYSALDWHTYGCGQGYNTISTSVVSYYKEQNGLATGTTAKPDIIMEAGAPWDDIYYTRRSTYDSRSNLIWGNAIATKADSGKNNGIFITAKETTSTKKRALVHDEAKDTFHMWDLDKNNNERTKILNTTQLFGNRNKYSGDNNKKIGQTIFPIDYSCHYEGSTEGFDLHKTYYTWSLDDLTDGLLTGLIEGDTRDYKFYDGIPLVKIPKDGDIKFTIKIGNNINPATGVEWTTYDDFKFWISDQPFSSPHRLTTYINGSAGEIVHKDTTATIEIKNLKQNDILYMWWQADGLTAHGLLKELSNIELTYSD